MQPLTSKQSLAWMLFQKGFTPTEIANRLKTTRQYVHQTLKISEGKISRTLLETARLNGLDIKAIQPEKGLLLGYNPVLRRKVLITYTAKNGLRIWYWYDKPDEVKDVRILSEAREYLINEAEERGMALTADQKRLHPASLAEHIFATLLPELRT